MSKLLKAAKEKMAFSEDLLAQRNKLQNEILALESSLGNGNNLADLLSSDGDSDEESVDSGHAGEVVVHKDLEAERNQIQREIEELERTLGADAALVDALTDSEHGSPVESDGDEDLDLPQDLETCLQMNLVYQEVLQEKLAGVERLLNENREQQKDLEEQLSGPSYVNPGLPHLKLFLGSFMKPYFKDKLTGLGPPANEETRERMSHGTKPCDEMKIRRWEPWQKTLLINSVVTDTMKRMLQPKLSKMEYLTAKMSKAEKAEKEEIQNQITLLENDITKISSLKEDQLYGDRHDDHDWDKISNIDFEGLRQPDDLMRFWQNYLHPSINKSTWSQDEIAKLADAAEEHECSHWEQIAESLGSGRTAFMCFQTYQRYISKRFRKREWNQEEDKVFLELLEKMRIGNFIPYTQISYFMEGRDSSQLIYRWSCVLDPSIKKGPWTKDEDKLLLKAVKKYGCKEWWKIRLEVPGRTDNSCRDRYLDCLQANIKRGAWSEEEVELLKKLVEKHGVGKWSKIAAEIPNRVDSQCLNKWKWMTQRANKQGVRRVRKKKNEPPSKKMCTRQQKLSKSKDDDIHTESDTSKAEKGQVTYMDSDGEQAGEKQGVRRVRKKKNEPPSKKMCTRQQKLSKSKDDDIHTESDTSKAEKGQVTYMDSDGEQAGEKQGVRRVIKKKNELPSKKRCTRQQKLSQSKDDDFHTESDTSKEEKGQVTYMDSDGEQAGEKQGVKRVIKKKNEPPSKKRRTRQQKLSKSKDDFHTESDTSEEEQVTYMDSDGEQAGEIEVSPQEDCKLEYVQPDMKKWIPVCENNLEHSSGKVKTISVRLPSEAEESARGSVRNTVLDRLGKPVKTYVGMAPPALGKCNLSNEHALIMVSECDVRSFLIYMRSSLMTERTPKSKDSLSSCTNKKGVRNVTEKDKSAMENGQRRCKSVHKTTAKTQLKYDLMLAITPWVGNVIMPLPFNERRVCEVDIVGKRAADVPLVKTPVFLLFLQALKIDVDGCKKVIQARNERTPMAPGPNSRPYSAKKPTPGSSRYCKTVAELLAEKNRAQLEKQSEPLQFPELFGLQLQPKPAKIPIRPLPRQTGKTKQSASQQIDAALILPQTFIITQPNTDNKAGTTHNTGQGISPFLQLGAHDASQVPQPVLHLEIPVESGMETQKASCPKTSNGPATKTSGELGNAKRKHKPTMKAQALMAKAKTKLSKKQADKKQQNSSINQAVAVLPQTTAWIITPAGLMPVAGVQIQAPGIPGHEKQMVNKAQMAFQPPVTFNQSGCVSPTNVKTPSNPASYLPENITGALNAGSYLVTDNHNVSLLPSSSNFPGVPSVTNMVGVSQDLSDTNVPTSALHSTKTSNSKSPLVPVSSSPVGPSQNLTASCNADANNMIPKDSVTSSITSVHPLNISDPSTVPGPQSQIGPNPVSQPVFQQPILINQNGFLTLINTAGSFQSNSSPAATANIAKVLTTSTGNNSLPTCANPIVSSVTICQQILPQTELSTIRSKQMTFDPSLMFFEQPDEVKNWMNGNDGITLPGLENKMPYLPPFVSSINTLTTLLKGRDSLLKSAVQILPEEQRDNSDEDAKIAAVRKMVSERLKSNQAYLLLKARFLSCFTLPALLATINPYVESADAPDQEDGLDKDNHLNPLGSLLNWKESESTQFSGRQPRNQTDSHKSA